MTTVEEETPLQSRNGGAKALVCCGRLLNVGAIGALTVIVIFLFVQLQAVTYQVASEQQQLNQLKDQIANQKNQTEEINEKVEKEHSLTVFHMAGTFTLLTCLITMFHMTAHLRNFNQPFVQRKILAILWLSPIYSVTSFLSLIFPVAEGYLGIIKDFYEAYVIYQFLSFLIAVLGKGDRNAAVNVLARHADHLDKPYRCLGCVFHPPPQESDKAMANAVLLECQILAMQFVLFRPLTSVMMFVLDTIEDYHDNDTGDEATGWSFFYSPKFFIIMIQNVSVFFAFAGLLKFYHAVRDDLSWCQPFSKFLTIKGIVFMTFWQGLTIAIIYNLHSGARWDDPDAENSNNNKDSENPINTPMAIQNVLICVEMLFFSIAHWCVFPTEEWEDEYLLKYYERPGFGFKDFASDVSVIVESGRAARATRKKKRKGLEALPTEEAAQNMAQEGLQSTDMDERFA